MELVWFGGIKSQIKEKVNFEKFGIYASFARFYWRIAVGPFVSALQGFCFHLLPPLNGETGL